jgi:hypothetical protein
VLASLGQLGVSEQPLLANKCREPDTFYGSPVAGVGRGAMTLQRRRYASPGIQLCLERLDCQIRARLQKAVKCRETDLLATSAISHGAHQGNVLAHEWSDASLARQRAQHLESPVGIDVGKCAYDRRQSGDAVSDLNRRNRVDAQISLLHQVLEEAVHPPCMIDGAQAHGNGLAPTSSRNLPSRYHCHYT